MPAGSHVEPRYAPDSRTAARLLRLPNCVHHVVLLCTCVDEHDLQQHEAMSINILVAT